LTQYKEGIERFSYASFSYIATKKAAKMQP